MNTTILSERDRKSYLAVNLGLGINILLAGFKTTIGIIGHSPALLAEGINSTSDVAYYVVASIFLRLASKPADDKHPYGHQQLESIASVVVGAFIVTTAVAVFWDAVDKIWDLLSKASPTNVGASQPALWMALLTVAIKLFLTFYTRKLGKDTRNPVVEAMAYDHRNDLFSATAASLGIFLGQRGLPWVDPLAGGIVALLILRTGIFILRESSVELMDTIPGRELTAQISAILKHIPGVQQLHEVQAHRFGPKSVINVTIGVDGNLPIREGDKIAQQVDKSLRNALPDVRRVHVHIRPSDKSYDDMTIDQIMAESFRRTNENQSEFFD